LGYNVVKIGQLVKNSGRGDVFIELGDRGFEGFVHVKTTNWKGFISYRTNQQIIKYAELNNIVRHKINTIKRLFSYVAQSLHLFTSGLKCLQ
jgi:hypothetical protein